MWRKTEPSQTAVGNIKWCGPFDKQAGSFSNDKI